MNAYSKIEVNGKRNVEESWKEARVDSSPQQMSIQQTFYTNVENDIQIKTLNSCLSNLAKKNISKNSGML